MAAHHESDVRDMRYDEVTIALRDHFREIGEQWSRIWALTETPPLEEGESVPSEEAARQASTLLWNLWLHSTPDARTMLKERTFITRTGYGTYQFEWKKGPRYLEVEIAERGALAGLAEYNGTSDEFEEDEPGFVSRFNAFWMP